MRSQFTLCLFACLLGGLSAPASSWGASIYSIVIGNANVLPNGTTEVEVTIAGTGDAVNLVGYEFRISAGSSASQLQFLEESESFLSDVDYLFAGNSLVANDGVSSSVGAVSTSLLPNDTFIGGDSSDDFADVTTAGSKLLVTLVVKHLAGPVDPLTTVGQQFAISLVPVDGDSSEFAEGTSNTGFLASSLTGVAFVSQLGMVTVTIPEPSTVSLAMVACLTGMMRRGRRTGSQFRLPCLFPPSPPARGQILIRH